MKGDPWKPCRSGTGAALVIVLAFIVLIAALMVIFFTQAISYRNQGNSSFNNFKSSALAQSGLATVVGDLQQEIVNGSTTVSYGSGTNVYYPTGNTNAVPQRSGNPALVNGGDPTPNLVRISVRTETYPTGSPGVSSRASADSTTNAAASGQYISPARWNQHYLLPRASAGSTTIDTTPTNAFSAPDWTYVTSTGPTVITAPSSKVIGRYAYAIYDEGGLLDANVAGFPSNTSTNSTYASSGVGPSIYNTNVYGGSYPMWGSGLKGTEAFADLTVPITTGTTTVPMLTQTQIDNLVGWRNNATAVPTGTYNDYAFSSTAAMTYHDWAVNTTNGYLATSGNSYKNSTGTFTDQAFASRQALIAFANDATPPISQDSLQYLGTFTRALEQPCYVPPVGRPQVQNKASNNNAPFGTGNDAWGIDRTASPSLDINPPFLAVRVGVGGWARADGTTAVAGEPLLKKRFPLSRLSLFPTNRAAPSAAAAQLIYNYFGLTQNATTGFWTYNHGSPSTEPIYKLSEVAALPASSAREPDFFELLRAAVNVGSLAKAASYQGNSAVTYWSSSPSASSLQQARDTQAQLQILQIGANIIDQSKADDYPTQIAFSATPTTVVRGVEDLPYLYRVHNWIMRTGTTGSLGEILFQPELWNPHSTSASANVPKTSMPTSFQVRLTLDPASAANTQPYTFSATYSKGTTAVTADLTPFCVFTSPGVGGGSSWPHYVQCRGGKQVLGFSGTDHACPSREARQRQLASRQYRNE